MYKTRAEESEDGNCVGAGFVTRTHRRPARQTERKNPLNSCNEYCKFFPLVGYLVGYLFSDRGDLARRRSTAFRTGNEIETTVLQRGFPVRTLAATEPHPTIPDKVSL